MSQPYAHLTLGVKQPWGHASLLTDCPAGSAHESKNITLPSNRSGNLNFCFEALMADDGQMLVPFEGSGANMLLHGAYTTEVMAYADRYAAQYVPDITIIKALEDAYSKARWDKWSEALLGCLIGVGLLFVLMKIVGWIVRGFMGIPNGMDHKRSDAP